MAAPLHSPELLMMMTAVAALIAPVVVGGDTPLADAYWVSCTAKN